LCFFEHRDRQDRRASGKVEDAMNSGRHVVIVSQAAG
jgi:hypothetical protein